MSNNVACPRCGQSVEGRAGCQHLRWTPHRGDPVEFVQHVVRSSPYTKGRGFNPGDIPPSWWAPRGEWILERIVARLDVVGGGFCFGELVDLDRLCMDIWHEFAPDAERRLSAVQAVDD